MRGPIAVARVGVLLATIWLAALLTAQVASAHAVRVAAEPADGAALATGPDRVSATLQRAIANQLRGDDGRRTRYQHVVYRRSGGAGRGGQRRRASTWTGPGNYTVNYRVTSADGHVVAGSWSFRLQPPPGTGAPGPAAAGGTDNGDDAPVWPFVLITVAIVGAGALWATRRRPCRPGHRGGPGNSPGMMGPE